MILVDTSVWVDHLSKGDKHLAHILTEGVVLGHEFVIGDLACGNIRKRIEILSLLDALPKAKLASHEEAMLLVDDHRLHGQGIGWIDAHLLASALISRAAIWTRDKRLRRFASRLRIEYAGTN